MSIELDPLFDPTTQIKDSTLPVVNPTSYITLHYRLFTNEKTELMSTFDKNPATLQLGSGQLAPALEQSLIGMREGEHQMFHLTPEQAFGIRHPDLVQPVSHQTLIENSVAGERYEVGDAVEFVAPSGGRFAGVLVHASDKADLFDFNHPLAGKELFFEVKLIGVL